jgi:hypothetical protein
MRKLWSLKSKKVKKPKKEILKTLGNQEPNNHIFLGHCFIAFGVQRSFVKLKLAIPWHFRSLKTNKR